MNSDHPNSHDPLYRLRMISKNDLRTIVCYSDQHLLRLEKAGKFPRRIQLGDNRVAWFVWQIEAWLRSRSSGGGSDGGGMAGLPLSPLPHLRGGGAAMPIPSKGARHDR